VPFQPAAHDPGQVPVSLAQMSLISQRQTFSQLLPKKPSSHSAHEHITSQGHWLIIAAKDVQKCRKISTRGL